MPELPAVCECSMLSVTYGTRRLRMVRANHALARYALTGLKWPRNCDIETNVSHVISSFSSDLAEWFVVLKHTYERRRTRIDAGSSTLRLTSYGFSRTGSNPDHCKKGKKVALCGHCRTFCSRQCAACGNCALRNRYAKSRGRQQYSTVLVSSTFAVHAPPRAVVLFFMLPRDCRAI